MLVGVGVAEGFWLEDKKKRERIPRGVLKQNQRSSRVKDLWGGVARGRADAVLMRGACAGCLLL